MLARIMCQRSFRAEFTAKTFRRIRRSLKLVISAWEYAAVSAARSDREGAIYIVFPLQVQASKRR